MQKDEFCLLLTATILPHKKDWVNRNDEKVRLNDYCSALKQWLTRQNSLTKIVMVENSGSSLEALKNIVDNNNPRGKKVEFLSYQYEVQRETGIELGELDAIDFAIRHSQLIPTCNKFVKVTGRLFVSNIDDIIHRLHQGFHVISAFSENLCYVDSSLVIFDRDFYSKKINDYAISCIRHATNRTDFEQAYARAIHRALADDYRWYPFPIWPIIEGISGTKNKKYSAYTPRRSLVVTLISSLYHRLHRNAYTNKKPRKHLLERWGIQPKT